MLHMTYTCLMDTSGTVEMRVGRIFSILSLMFLVVSARDHFGDCNVAMCLGSSPTVSNAEYEMLRDSIMADNGFARKVATTHNNVFMGAGIYSDYVNLRHRCYPRTSSVDRFLSCVYGIFRSNRDTDGSNLGLCLEMVCNHNNFYLNTRHDRFYDLVIVTDSASSDPAMTSQWIDKCREKGFVFHCLLVGTDAAATAEYEQYCDKFITQVPHYGALRQALDVTADNTCTEPSSHEELICRDAVPHKGAAYAPHPNRCDSVIRCEHDASGKFLNHSVEVCGCGDFWNHALLACMPLDNVTCTVDPCAIHVNIKAYPYPDNCRTYLGCENRRTMHAYCCKDGMRYNEVNQQCIADPTSICKDKCPCPVPTIPGVKEETKDCQGKGKTPNPGNPNSFMQIDSNGQIVPKDCLPGYVYNQAACECDIIYNRQLGAVHLDFSGRNTYFGTHTQMYPAWSGPQEAPVPESSSNRVDATLGDLQKTFYGGSSHKSPRSAVSSQCSVDFSVYFGRGRIRDQQNSAYIKARYVKVDRFAGHGTFSGKSSLRVPRFKNYDWRRRFGIILKFNPGANPNLNTPLFSNSVCRAGVSVEIRLDTEANLKVVVAEVVMTKGTVKVSVPYRPSEANTILMKLKNRQLKLTVQYEDGGQGQKQVAARGMVMRRNCPVYVGRGASPRRFFTGTISQVDVYTDLNNCVADKFPI